MRQSNGKSARNAAVRPEKREVCQNGRNANNNDNNCNVTAARKLKLSKTTAAIQTEQGRASNKNNPSLTK